MLPCQRAMHRPCVRWSTVPAAAALPLAAPAALQVIMAKPPVAKPAPGAAWVRAAAPPHHVQRPTRRAPSMAGGAVMAAGEAAPSAVAAAPRPAAAPAPTRLPPMAAQVAAVQQPNRKAATQQPARSMASVTMRRNLAAPQAPARRMWRDRAVAIPPGPARVRAVAPVPTAPEPMLAAQ